MKRQGRDEKDRRHESHPVRVRGLKLRHGLCFCRIPLAGKEDILSHYNPKSPYKVPTYYSTKDDALQAFLRRKDPNGMNLSKRVWNLTPEYRTLSPWL